MSTVETEEATRTDVGYGVGPMKRHIVAKLEGAVADAALCGALWDRLHPQRGEICPECREIYEGMRPGWPLPR